MPLRFLYILLLAVLFVTCGKDPVVSEAQSEFFYKVFGGSTTANDCVNGVAANTAGELFLTGSIKMGSASHMFLIKTDVYGNQVNWSPVFFNSILKNSGNALGIDQSNNIITAGKIERASGGDNDFFITKSGPDGAVLWTKTVGGSKDDEAFSVEVSDPDKYFVAGITNSKFEAVDKKTQAWLVALSMQGDSLWSYTYGGDGSDTCNSILSLDNNYLLLVGSTNSFNYSNKKQDVLLAKVQKSNGVPVSSVTLGKSTNETGITAGIDADGNIIVLGYVQVTSYISNIYIWKLAPDLSVIKEDQIESTFSEKPSSLNFYNGNIVIAGSASNDQSNLDMIVYILSKDLGVVSSQRYGARGDQQGMCSVVSGKSIVIGGSDKAQGESKASLLKITGILP
jgi:hypothetical protein